MFKMNEKQIINIIEQLKTSSRTQIYHNLTKVRQEIISNETGIKQFQKHGGIIQLINILHKPNEKITDLVLSILANCCMNQDCATHVDNLNGIRYVIHIIKNIGKDSILCRACRVIGNIAQHEHLVDQVHQYGTSAAIGALLDQQTELSPPTKLMAIRALRLLWTNSLRQQQMLSQNIVKIVSMVIIHHKDQWETNESVKDLLIGALRCILHFTENPSHDLVQQIIADGSGFQAITSLIPLQPYMSVKCITNLATVATTRSQLAYNEAVDLILNRLTGHMETNPKSWPREELSALCLLCRHAATREEIRTKNGLPLLLSVIKNSDSKYQQGQVLHALVYFIYDEVSLQLMISEGLVPILISCFSQLLLEMKCHHDINPKRVGAPSNKRELERLSSKRLLKRKSPVRINLKRGHDLDEESNENKRSHQSESDRSSPTSFDTRLSPQPSSSCYSPSSSPIRSSMESDSDDSVRYSPVCSDSESEPEININEDSELNFANFENEDFVHYELGSHDLENALEEETKPKIGEAPTLGWLLVLLSRTSYMEDVDPKLAHSDTIDTLLQYMQVSSYPVTRAARILFRIISRWDFLMILLKTNSVMKIYKLLHNLPHGDICTQCNELKKFLQMIISKITCVAESGYGKGRIAHSLLRDDDENIKNIIVTLPYLIQSKTLIRSFFNQCRGLKKLLTIISDNDDTVTLYNDAVNSLGLLATKLKIKDPLNNETFRPIHQIGMTEISNISNPITFELDDDTQITANKTILTDQSPFFKALLYGQFKESKSNLIHLGDVTPEGFNYLLNLLEYSTAANDESFPLSSNLATALEVLELTDRYLLEKLTDLLTRAILKIHLTAATVAQIYKWSVESGTDFLRVESIAFGLVGVMGKDERVNIFNEVVQDGFLDPFLKDCRVLLYRHLNII